MAGLGTGAPIVQVYHEKSFILPDVSRVLACLYEKDVKFDTHTASYKSLLRLQASSHAPVPFYDGPTFLEESREICRYIAEKYEHQGYPLLLGKDALERASVEQWLHNEQHAFNPPSRALFCHLAFPLGEEEDDDIDIHTRKLEEVLEVYEQRLSDSEFLVGNKFTLADLVHLPNSHYIKASNKFLYLYDSRKNVRRWWDAISDRDSWKKVLRYMKRVEEQNKQEELKKKPQQDPRTSVDSIRLDPREPIRTEPRTILVPPDTVSSSSIVTGVASQYKEAVPYSGHTPPEHEPADTSASKLHTTDVHHRPQVEQWHSATTGLNDLKHDADHLASTQQGKPGKDVQQYPPQDLEQATSHSVPQEPMSRELVQGREKTARRPYTDKSQDVSSQLEDYASSDQRGALLPPSTQEHGVTPSRQVASKDARRRILSQAGYPGGQGTSKQPRDRGSVPRQGEPQDAREIFDESQAVDSSISSEGFSYTSQSSLPRQDLDSAGYATTPFETRYPGAEDTSKQAEDKISTPWQMADHDAGDITEETKVSESSSFQVQPSYFDRADAPSRKQETIDDTFKEAESGGPSFHRDQQSGTWQTTSSLAQQEVNQGGRSVAPPSQTRYQIPSKTRHPIAEDASKQARGTAPTPKKKAAQDDSDTSEESKIADEVASVQKRYPYDGEDRQVANTASVSWKIAPDGDKSIEETKLPDSRPTSAKPMYTQETPFPPPRQAEVTDTKDKGRQSTVTIPESQKMVSRDAQTTHGERKTGTPGEQSSDRLQAIPQSRLPAAEGLSTKKDITNEQTVMPSLLSNEPTSRVQPASELLQVASHGSLSTKPSTIEKWQRASVPLNDISSSSGDGESGMATIDQKLTPSQQATPSSEDVNKMAKESGKQRVEPPVQTEAETPGVQSASPSFPGASTAHHATSDDKFSRQLIIDGRVREPTKMPPTPYSAPAHTKRETPDGQEIDSELVSTPDEHISEAAEIRQDQATVHEDVHDANLSADDVAKDTFKGAKIAESTPSSAKPMYPQQPAPTSRHAEVGNAWDKRTKGSDRQQMLEKWAGTARGQVSDRWKASPPSRQAAAEDVRGVTGDTIQYPDVLDTSKESRGAYEEAKDPGSVKEEKTSSIYQQKPQYSQEQAQTIPAGEKGDGSIRKHHKASDPPNTFVEKLDASEPARVKTHGDFSAGQPYRKDTTDDQKVASPLSTRELTSEVQPPSEPSYDAALHRDLSSKPSTIYPWQRSSVPLHDVTRSSGDDEVAESTFDEKPTPMSEQKYDDQRAEPPVPMEVEMSDVQHASSFPGASMDDHTTINDKFSMHSIIDQRVGKPSEMQTSSPDAYPASEPTKRETPEGHGIGHLELVSTPGGQISEAKKARDDPAAVHEDVYDVNLSTQDVGKDAFKETKVADSIPSSAQPMHIQKPALTPSRQIQVEEARDRSMQSRETIPEQQKKVERKTVISGEQLSDRQKEIRPSRQTAAEDAPISDTIQSPDILDTPNKFRAAFEEYIAPGSTLPRAQVLEAQDFQLTKGESTVPTTDQRNDWKYAKDDETIMTEGKSLSTERPRDKVDGSTSEHHESSGTPYTYNEKLSASAPARADIYDGHGAEEQYKKYTVDDQKVTSPLSSKEPASEVQPASEPLQRAVSDGDLPSKLFTIDQWKRTAAPLHGVITDSGDDEAANSSNNDKKTRPMSQEATPSSQSVNQMAKQSGEQRLEPPVPIVAETSDVGRAAPSLPEAARADVPTISDKFTEQSNIDERVGKPKQMQAPSTAAHPDSARTLRRTLDSHKAGELVSTPEGERLERAKATRDPATIHEDVYDASLSIHDGASDEKTAMDHASSDEVVTESLHDRQGPRPASTQAQPTVETPHDSDSFQYVHTGDSGKTELAKPTLTDQEATLPAAGPTPADPQRTDIIPARVAHSEQKSSPSDKGSAHATQHPSPVEPIKADSNVSAANYTNAPQMIFRQEARPPAPSTIGIRASDTQGVIGKIREVSPDNRGTGDSGKPFVPSQEYVSHASEAIPGQEEMTSPQGARVFPTSDNQLSSSDVHEVTPDDQQNFESITPLVSSGKQGSHVRSPFKPGEVGPEKKFARSDEESPHSSEESIYGEPRKEQTVIPTAERTTAQPTIIGRQDIPDRKQALTSEDTLNDTATDGDVHHTGTIEPARRPLSVEGEELTSATQAPSPSGARDSFHTELENVQSVKPSATKDVRDITPSSAPGEAALAEQKSASSGQGSADPAQPAFSLGPRNEEIRDSSPSAMPISSTDPSKRDPMVGVSDQAKDSETTLGQQDILSTEHPSGKVQENIPGDNLGKAKPSRPSSAIQEGESSKASASGTQLGSVPNELSVGEQNFAPPGQDSAYLARPPFYTEPRSKEIGDLAPSSQLNSTTDLRNKDAIVAAPDQTMDSQKTPGRQVKFSALSSLVPLGKLQEDEPADDSGEKSSKPPSLIREGKPAAAVPISAPDTQHGGAPDEFAVEQKFSLLGQDSVHSVQTSFSTEPTKEDTVVAPTDQTSTLERTVDENYMISAADKAKTPLSETPDASRKIQKGIEDGHIDEKLPSQRQVYPGRHVSESPQGRSPEAHSDVVDKEAMLGSSEAETSKTGPGSTSISADGHFSSSDMPAAGSLPETQDLQDSTSAQNVLTNFLGKTKSPGHLSTDQAMAPIMSPPLPSVSPLGTVPGTNSLQPPRQASTSTVDLESVPDTQNGIPQGKATPDQEPTHTTERPSSTEPRKEEANTAGGDQANVTKGPETTVRHLAKAPPPDSREALQKYLQPSHAVLPSDIRDGPTPRVPSAVVDKETTQTSLNEPNITPTHGDVLPTRSVQNQEAQPTPATQAPTSQGLQDSAFPQNDSYGNIKSPRQDSTNQIVASAINSAAPIGDPQGTEPGPESSASVQTPFSTEPTKEDTIVTAADQAEDTQTIANQQAITPAPDTAKPASPDAQDVSRKLQESIPDDGPVQNYSPKLAAQTQPPAATLDVSPYASSNAKSTGQGAKPPTGYRAAYPETQLGSSQTQGEAAPAEQKFAVTDEKTANTSKSFASAEPREEDTGAGAADQTSVPPTDVIRQVTRSTPDANALSSDQKSSPDNGQIRNLQSPLVASQEEASRAGCASHGSSPKAGGDARLSGVAMPATSSMEMQEPEFPAATQAPTSKGLQDSGNIESPRQASTDQAVTPAMHSEAPSDAPEGSQPGPESSRSTQTLFSTEPTKEDTIVTAADQAGDMQTITHQQAITPVPDTAKPPFPGVQEASRKFQESSPDDGPVENYSPKPAAQTQRQPPAATQDVSPYALSEAKSTGQGAKPPTGYRASSPGTQLGSSQTQGEATPAEQNFGVSDEKFANTSKSFPSAEPREDMDAATADQASVAPTNVTRQVTSSTPDASDTSSSDQKSSRDNGQIRNLPSPLVASQEEASRAGRASDGSTPKVHSAIVDEKRTLPSSQAQTSSMGPDSTQIGDDARLSGAGMPATSSMEMQVAESPAATQALASKDVRDSGNIESPRQASSDQTVTPAIHSEAPSNAPEGTEPGPESSASVQTPFSTEPTKEDTIVTAADQAEDTQTIANQQAITPAPDTAKPASPDAQDVSRKLQESIPDDGPVQNYSPKLAAQTQPPAATLDVSPYASSNAKSIGQGAKLPTGYRAAYPETQLGSSQTQGEAAPAEQKFAVSDVKTANTSKSFASAEPREEETGAGAADQTSVPPTDVIRQVTRSTPDASNTLSSDQKSSPDNGQIRNLQSPLVASQEEVSRAGRASDGSTSKVHSAIVDEKRTLPSSQAQTSSTGPGSTQIGDDARLSGAGMPATSSMEMQVAESPAATQALASKDLRDSGNIESPRQASSDQTMTPAIHSEAPSNAPEGTEPGPEFSASVQTPFSTEPTKEDTIVTAADQAEDTQTIANQQAITPAPDTAKPAFPDAQDVSRKFQESILDDGPVQNYSPELAAQTQPPAATLDVSPYASSNAKSTGQGAKPPTGYRASSPETQLGSSQTQGEATPAEQKFGVSDEKSANTSKSFPSAEPREEDMDAATADQASVPPTNVTRQVTSSTPDASDTLSSDQKSSRDNGQIRNLQSPLVASQEEASRAGRASDGSTPEVHSAIVDEKRTIPSSLAQTSSGGADSTRIGGDAHLSGAGMPATSSIEKQEVVPPAATQAPTFMSLQDSGNIESPRQASADQTVTPAMHLAPPSNAPEGTETAPESSRSIQTPFSTEPTNETIVTPSEAKDMQTISHHQAITPAPFTTKPPFPAAQDASRKFQESIPDDGPVENYSSKPAAQTQPPAATLDVSPYASSKDKSTGNGGKPSTGYRASSPETQLGSSQTQGEAAPAEKKFAVSDEKSANTLKSFASAEPSEEDTDAATTDQTSVPPTNVTRQVTSSTPDASEALSSDEESYPNNGQIRNLQSPLVASQEEASHAGHASEESAPKVHSAIVDEKRTLPSRQAQTSSTGPGSTRIGGDASLSGAGMPAPSSMEKQEAEPPAVTQTPTSKGLRDSGNIESPRQASTDQTVKPVMHSAAPSNAPEGTEAGPESSRSVQTPFSTDSTKEDTIVTAADQAEDMQTITHHQAITPAPDTVKPSFPGAQDASRKFQESIPYGDRIGEPPRGSSEAREGQTFDPYRTNVDEKTTTFPSSQAIISKSGSDLGLGDVVPSIGEGPAENYSPKPGAQTQLPAATQDVTFDASSKTKSTGQAAKAPTDYLASSPDTQLGSSRTQGEAEEKLPVSGMDSVQPSKGASFDVLSNYKTTTTQDQVKTLPNGDLSSNQVVEQSESADSKGVQSEDKTQGHETDAGSLETGYPSKGGLPANSYQNNSSQSQAEASKKSVEQSSGIPKKDNDSSRLDDSTNPTKPET